MELRQFLQTIMRHRLVAGAAILLGLAGGTAYTVLFPPMLTSKVLIVLPSTIRDPGTQAVVASSDPVLLRAMPRISPAVPLEALRRRVHAVATTPDLLTVSAQAPTASQAEQTANAVAASYTSYANSPGAPGGRVSAQMLGTATPATGQSLPLRVLIYGGLGLVAGLLCGGSAAFSLSRSDRKLRRRDDIADAIGVPVLASVPVARPSDAKGWARLLADYQPGPVHAWSLRKALHHLGIRDSRGGGAASVAVLSVSSDPVSLALGPQLAAFAASLGIRTALVVSPQPDTAAAAATLSAACSAAAALPAEHSARLRVITAGAEDGERGEGAALTVVTAVVDSRAPRVADTMPATATVLGVSAGAVTAEQLARVAVSAADSGRRIAGILVANPEPADQTTGRQPQPARPPYRRLPARVTGTAGTPR